MDNKENKVTGIRAYLPAFGVKGWIIAIFGICFFYFYKSPIETASNFFLTYLESAFGWNNTTVSTGITVGAVIGVISIPIWAPLNTKWGAKKLATVGLIGGAVSAMIFGLFPSLLTDWVTQILNSVF